MMERRFILFIVCLTAAFYFLQARRPQEEKPAAAKHHVSSSNETNVNSSNDNATTTPRSKKPAKYYLLQNNYQQLIISSKGGYIVEINLPFQSKKDQESVVLPIGLDREIVQDSPQNAQFPLHQAIDFQGKAVSSKEGGFYPLLRRGVVGNDHISPYTGSAAVVSEYPEIAEIEFFPTEFSQNTITLEGKGLGRTIQKKFSFIPTPQGQALPYCVQIEITVTGERRGLWVTSGIPEVELISGSVAPQVKYHITRKGKGEVDLVDLPKEQIVMSSLAPNWAVTSNGFFGLIMDPLSGQGNGFKVINQGANEAPSRLLALPQELAKHSKDTLSGYALLFPLQSHEPRFTYRLFAGPLQSDILEEVDHFFAQIDKTKPSDYIACQTFHGWFSFISEPFAKFLFMLMKAFYSLFGSWVLSIVLITIVLRVLLSPLNNWSMRSMKAMQELSPKLQAIQERYKKDPARLQAETLSLYREHRVNPLSGCLPLLIQMPFLIGMFDLLKSSFELRGAPWIPGWIDNLAAPDVLFSWHVNIPFLGSNFHLLPLILGGTMVLQQRLSSTLPKDQTLWTEQQRQQRAVGSMMAVMMTVLFYNFPAGLNIYWISSSLLAILQQWNVNRKLKPKI
jgi:YidC/Oxa1 family membrane protein insertase